MFVLPPAAETTVKLWLPSMACRGRQCYDNFISLFGLLVKKTIKLKLTALKQAIKRLYLFDFMSVVTFCVCFFNLLTTINIIVIQTSVFNDSKQYLLKYTFTIG